MTTARNPFTPTFGTVPAHMAGRDRILRDMRQAFEEGPGNPKLSTILIGARGTGKTALLSRMCDEAAQAGWITASTTALPGMLEDLYEQTLRAGRHLFDPAPAHELTSVSVGPVSAGWRRVPESTQGNWRTRMTDLLDQLHETGTGLLLTVDEVRAGLDELVQLVAVYQHFVTERRAVALVMSGLPYHVHRLISDKSVSFLRRSTQHQLGRIPDADVGDAIRQTLLDAGKRIDDAALDICTDAVEGFAFMLQLVGYHVWIQSGDAGVVSVEHAHRGVVKARQDMEASVLASTYRELSRGDVRFLEAMLPDAHESRVADIASRMDVSSGYASKYKSRLLAAGVIGERGRGACAIEMPGMRAYVETRRDERLAEEASRQS